MAANWDYIVRILANGLRDRDPNDPATLVALDGNLARIRRVLERMDENARTSPEPSPGKPWPRVPQLDDEEAEQVRQAVLTQLRDR